MAAVFKSFGVYGPASALLLLAALLAAGARADDVTTAECAARGGGWGRVRQYPVDSNATTLKIDFCELTGFQQRPITGLPGVTALYLSWNKLRELPVFEERVCANLTVLSLNSNQLTKINSGAFSTCAVLKNLYMSDNKIQVIHYSAFTTLTNLKVLWLDNNTITDIPDQLFANNDKLKELYLFSNRLTLLPPGFVTSLKRAGAGLEVFYFHNNPWHCACLVELLVDVKRAGVLYSGWFYDGTRPVCEFSGAVRCPQPGLLRPARGGC